MSALLAFAPSSTEFEEHNILLEKSHHIINLIVFK